MIYKHMFCGYSDDNKVELLSNDEIITSSAAYFEEEKLVFVYYESKNEALSINDVVKGNMKKFPNGSDWTEMVEIFHYFTPKNDEEWTRKIPNKTANFRINKINMDHVASYIYHHQDLQYHNQYGCDKFFSIFLFGNIGIIYGEDPIENVTWADIEGRVWAPTRSDWCSLMNEHFKAWPDGHKGWVALANAAK